MDDLQKVNDEIEKEVDPEVAFYGDLRRKRLTLEHINKLRKVRDLREYENKSKIAFIHKMYARPAPP